MLVLSHRMERLVDFLAERLCAESSNPLCERWVLLPGKMNCQWLMIALIERMPRGAISGLQMMTWREALHKISRSKGHPILGDFELRLMLEQVFQKGDLPLSFSPLKEWLGGKSSSRLVNLTRSLAQQMVEAGLYGFDLVVKEWQRDLFRLIAEETTWRFPVQLVKDLRLPSSVSQVHCFCTDEMPLAGWELFLKEENKTSVYLFSPCQMFWEDLRSDRERLGLSRAWHSTGKSSLEEVTEYLKDTHPILANWGRLGRKTLLDVERESLEKIEAYEEDEGKFSLLQRVQQDLLFLRTIQDEKQELQEIDGSLEIVAAGSSKLREMQILRDRLLHYLDTTQADCKDILVLAPDIQPYESLIHFVLGEDLPYRIAPTLQLPGNGFCQGLLLFLKIADGDWEVDPILELFENSAFQGKHALTSEDLLQFRIWLQEAKIRGGWDTMKGNWVEGLKRIVFGLVYLLPEEEGCPRIESIDLGQSARLDLFLSLLQEVREQSLLFDLEVKRTLEEWACLMEKAANSLFLALQGEAELFRIFLRKIASLTKHFEKELFRFANLKAYFEDFCCDAISSYQPHLWQAIQFTSLRPGALRPARAIFLLGMDFESFPEKRPITSFDWKSSKPLKSDVDRYLLLQLLFAAKERLSISYCHISAEDGKSVEMALPIQELLQTIDLFYGESAFCKKTQQKISDALTISHPALPNDRRYFEPGSALFSYSQDAYRAAKSSFSPAIFWPMLEREKKERPLLFQLSDFKLLATNPWKFFLRRKLGVFLREENLFSTLRRQDFSLPVYLEKRLLRLALFRPLEEIVMRYDHEWPPGAFGSAAKERIEQKIGEWNKHLQEWGIQKEKIIGIHFSTQCQVAKQAEGRWMEAPPLRITLECGETAEIVGELDWIIPSGLLTDRKETLFLRLFSHWPEMLVNLLYMKQNSMELYSLQDGKKDLVVIDAISAMRRWIHYFMRAEETLSPLIKPWVDSFLRKGFEEWKKKSFESLMQEEDLSIRWVAARATPFPIERIWEEWNLMLQETFAELLVTTSAEV